MLRVPGEPARVVDQPVSLMDVAPTVLTALGLPAHGNFQGRGDLLSPDYDASGRIFPFTIQGLTREDGLLLDGWKYIVNWDRRDRQLYDLAQDPGERTNLADRYPGQVQRLHGALTAFLDVQLAYYADQRWRGGHYAPAVP